MCYHWQRLSLQLMVHYIFLTRTFDFSATYLVLAPQPLLERLLGRVTDLLAVLLGASALACVGLIGHHDLVHQLPTARHLSCSGSNH